MSEKRRHPRLSFSAAVAINPLDGATTTLYGKALDLFTRGIGIRFEQELLPGDRYHIEFRLPIIEAAQPIRVGCEVMHCRYNDDLHGYQIGLMFADITSDDSRLIHEYIRRGMLAHTAE